MQTINRNYFWAFIVAVSLFILPNQGIGQSLAYRTLLSTLYDTDFPTLKPTELSSALADFQILDSREKEEFEVSHLEGAKWVGFDTFKLENVAGLDKNKPVLVYCTVGARSQDIGKRLTEAGFTKVYNLYGGIIHWSNESMPLYQKGLPTNQVHTYSRSWGIWLEKGQKVY
ncbi:rhodanese-like domain-containing protein [Algoriphagus marinus]|uniref:rhodanese-like domain-containing protein n=1 Tax=Algoriphagus marinus TaxID=1925762 RepID=UPI0009F9CA8D|nr:rhodanese-like domain-containing protein [Algoriphagus marinus]